MQGGNLIKKSKRLNCWEFKNCKRELGGEFAFELGVCPASTDIRFDGVHHGINAGRACWVVAGTMCEGEVQGKFAQKYKNCGKCDFYNAVKKEEGKDFIPTTILFKRLEKDMLTVRNIKSREEFRCNSHQIIEYVLKHDTDEQIFKAVTVNLSANGLCLYVFNSLNKGQEIIIKSGLRVNKPASVQWKKKLDDDLYKVGLMFV